MPAKGKGIEKKKPPRPPATEPSIDDCDAEDCSSQCIEDISEPASAGPVYVKGRGGEAPYIPSPRDPSILRSGGARESSSARRALDPEEMNDASENVPQHAERVSDVEPDEIGDSGEGSSGGEDASNTEVGGLGGIVRRGFFTPTYGHIVENTESDNELSDYLNYLSWNSDSSDTSPEERQSSQSAVTIAGLDSEDEIYDDDGLFNTPLDRVPSHNSLNSSSIGLGSSSMIYTENSRSSRGSPRRGDTYNPTILRRPQPVQLLNMERGWTPPPPPPPRQTPLELALPSSSLDGEGPLMEDPPPYDDFSGESDGGVGPSSQSFSRYRRKEPCVPPTELETVVEEDEGESAESVVARPGSTPYRRSPLGEDSLTNLTAPSGLDALPSYTTSVHPTMSLASGPLIEHIQSSEQSAAPVLAPIHLAPIHLAPIILTPISAEQEPDIPPDLSHLSHFRVNTVSLPEYPSQRVFTQDPAFRSFNIDHADLLQIPPRTQLQFRKTPLSRKEASPRFQKPPIAMEKSMEKFRDFAASATPMTDRNILTPLYDYLDEDSPEEESGTSEKRPPACLGRNSPRMTELIAPNTLPSLTPSIMCMEKRWGVEATQEISSRVDGSGLRYTKDGRRRRVVWRDDSTGSSDGWDRRTNKDKKCNRHYHHSPVQLSKSPLRTYPTFQDRELRIPSPDIGVGVFPPQDDTDWRVPRPTRTPPARPPAPASNKGFRRYPKSISGTIEHHPRQLTQSGANWSEIGDWNCKSCAWSGPRTSTECFRCHSTTAFEVPKAVSLSMPPESCNQLALPEESAQDSLHKTASIMKGSEKIEPQAEEPEQPHPPPESPTRPEDNGPQSESKKKKKKRHQNLDPK